MNEIPAFGSYNPQQAQAHLTQDVAGLAPLATHYSGAQSGTAVQYTAPTPSSSGSNLSKFTHFMGGLASQTGSIAEGAGKWLGTQIKSAVTAPIHYGEGLSHGLLDRSTLAGIDAQNANLTAKMDNLNLQYKSGKITSQAYKQSLADINQDFSNQVHQVQAINTKVKADQQSATQATVDTASLLTTILTAGFGKAAATEVTANGLKATDVVTAGQFLKGKAAQAYLGPVENAIGKIAGDSKVFDALSNTAKTAIQKATAEVVSTGANMSKGQIARAAAANLALKSPIYYNLISKTGDQLYTELQDKKYGDAVNTLAFNAALVLSGGPIGQALKYLGKFGKGATGAVFGQSSFLDTVDKELFGGKGLLYDALKDNPKRAQDFSDMRATHMSVTGADEVAAAYRMINGERSLAGDNYVARGPGAWMDHLSDYVSEQKDFSNTAKRLGMGNVVMAPWTANTVNFISEHLAQFPKEQWSQAFKDLQEKYSNSAWANNQNVIGNIEHIMEHSKDSTELLGNLKSIDAGKFQTGFPKAMVQAAALKGLIPIEAPAGAQTFHEGEGALATKYATGNETGTIVKPGTGTVYYHGTPKDFGDIKAGSETGLAQARQNLYVSTDKNIASQYKVGRDEAVVSPERSQLIKREAEIHNELGDATGAEQDKLEAELTKNIERQDVLKKQEADSGVLKQYHITGNVVDATTPEGANKIADSLKTIDTSKLSVVEKRYVNNFITEVSKGEDVANAARSTLLRSDLFENAPGVSEHLKQDGIDAITTVHQGQAGEKASTQTIVLSPNKLKDVAKSGSESVDTSAFFTHAVQPLPVLGTVGSLLRGIGLSPEASAVRSNQIFQSNLKVNLENVSIVKQFASSNGEVDDLVKKLSSYAHDPTRRGFSGVPVTDFRQLTNKDVRTALGVTFSQANEIVKAIASAHLQIDTAVKGLGEKAVDLLYSTKGINVISKRMLKTQGILRFGANPFFQYLRVIPKTEILSASEGGGFIKTLWNNQGKELKAVRKTLRDAGHLDEVGHVGLGGGLTGAEAVDQIGVTSKNLSKKLLPLQEDSIAGVIIDQAKRMNMATDDYIKEFPDKVNDTIQMIAEYDKKSSFLNSPLARTLNVAIFPFRFDSKVLAIMGRNLGKTDLFTQVAFVKGMMGAHDWLNSGQGKAWYQQNADAIGLFKYITPFANFNEIFHSLLPGNDHSLGNFGQLGGLPFGWIPSLLDSEGLTQFNQPGVDPKTGQTFTKYIPKDARGQVATAIQDMLSGMFSYPGATVGLPSKNKATLGIAQGLTGASAKDFNKTTPGDATPATAPVQPSSGIVPSVAVPAQATPATTPRAKSAGLKKKKKADYAPALLPGQTQYGQL